MQHLTVEPVDDAPEHTRRVELAELLEVAHKQLAPELRAIFLLREAEELPYRVIAQVVAIPEGTVGSRLNRARRLLTQYLLELEEQENLKCREDLARYEHLIGSSSNASASMTAKQASYDYET
ncbi:MAG: sigma factor-like helix-turn-helix DNA-binding protein [Aureliella sp.]